MNLQPLHDIVYVKLDKAPEKIGSIWVPEISRDAVDHSAGSMVRFNFGIHEGTVVSCGLGKWMKEAEYRRPMEVKPGDRIMFGQYADLQHDDMVAIREDDILGKVVSNGYKPKRRK